ncbi:MAG: inhibitor of methylation [Clostridia bacterium]|jgi:chemotaxis protein CheX|nr:inhibitor of methylation [Clostridia bacterium]
MDVKYINPFLTAFTNTLEQLSITEIKRGGMKKKVKLYVDLDVSTIIGIKGGVQGNIALSMSQDTAKKLASAMMMGMPVSAVDDMVKSAIGELSSMITGTASTMLSSSGILFQMSPPTVLLSPSDINALETLAIDFETPLGKIELNIGLTA